jgi:hypothetical protein
MTVGRDTQSRARRTTWVGEGVDMMNKGAGCHGSVALWKWAAQNHHWVGDAERCEWAMTLIHAGP